jgi:hypothetical protein
MTHSITHTTQVNATSFPDDGTSPVGTTEWNEAHTATMATGKLLGRTSPSTGPVEELDPDYGLVLAAGSGKLSLDTLLKSLTANVAYTNGTSAQNWFSTAGSATVAGSTTYLLDGLLLMTNGTTSHTVGLSFAGTATLTSIAYLATASAGAVNSTVTTQNTTMVTQATNTVVTAAITTAGTQIRVYGLVRVNAGGTFIPQFTFSVAPGAGNVLANTFLRLIPIGTNTVATIGSWA